MDIGKPGGLFRHQTNNLGGLFGQQLNNLGGLFATSGLITPPNRKFVSLVIIGHGIPIGASPPNFCSDAIVKVKYISSFGNAAHLNAKQDFNALKILSIPSSDVLNTVDEYTTFMDSRFNEAENIVFKQKKIAPLSGETINPTRAVTIESHNCLNKNFLFADPNTGVSEPNFGVFALHNNVGGVIKFKFPDKWFSSNGYYTTFQEIINIVSREYQVGTNDYIYVIDSTCNELVDKNAERAKRVNARYYQYVATEFNNNQHCLHNYFFAELLKEGGKKTQKKRKLKKLKKRKSQKK